MPGINNLYEECSGSTIGCCLTIAASDPDNSIRFLGYISTSANGRQCNLIPCLCVQCKRSLIFEKQVMFPPLQGIAIIDFKKGCPKVLTGTISSVAGVGLQSAKALHRGTGL